MLSCTGLGNDLFLAKTFCQYRLSHTVIDLVRARVVKVFSFEIDFCPDLFRNIGSIVKCRRTSHIVLVVVIDLFPEIFIETYCFVVFAQLFKGRHQGFRNETAAKFSKMPQFVRVKRAWLGYINCFM